jgi:ABC-type sugar transport system ATPase subunit
MTADAELSPGDRQAESGGPAPGTTLLRLESVAKAFGPTQALRDASFELRAGEVHALVGENGSGKSTLVKILSGVHAPDAGSMELYGETVQPPRTPYAAQQSGIVTVFQEVLVAEARSALDNVWLGVDRPLRAALSTREKRTRAAAAFEQLLGHSLALDRPVEELSLSDRQACCIVRALMRKPRILILDEATSSLDIATRDRLFSTVGGLSREGVGVIFITHRMDELAEIGDRVTVVRSGLTVGTRDRGTWTVPELVRMMTGSEQLTERTRAATEQAAHGQLLLGVKGLQLKRGGAPIDLELHAGEVVGVAGLEGHGQDEFLDALRGAGALSGQVVRYHDGKATRIRSINQAAQQGIAYVPRERRAATFRWMSIRENFGMPTLGRDTRGFWLQLRATRRRLAQYTKQLGIVIGGSEDAITTLSGGNQQKVVIARWLAADPKVLLLNDPTRGIDIGTKHQLYALLGELSERGMAVVMLSTELDEHVELMDRVLVFREHEMIREIARDALSRNSLVAAFFGQGDESGDGGN